MYAPSLQTHFNAIVDRDTLWTVRDFGFQGARIDAQTCGLDTLAEMLDDAIACELAPLPIVADSDKLRACAGRATDVEWGNEPDGDIRPERYRRALDEAAALALGLGIRLWAPALSNLDRDSLFWLEAVHAAGGYAWPAGLHGISVHRYGDGTFDTPHDGFNSRAEEVDALLGLCDGLPYIVTEFGYPTDYVGRGRGRTRIAARLSEADQAERIALEWDFWRAHGCAWPFLFQLNDGTAPDEQYGIRRIDGVWKPAAYQVPKNGGDMDPANLTDNAVFAHADLIEVPGRPGDYGLRYPIGAQTILSPKSNGQHETRPIDGYLGGADETCKVADDLVYFPNVAGVRLAWRLVE